ncbi:MAG: nickel pincer cofactor biosynthesis protein LarC [Desulfovibrionales bacterium]
MVFSLYLELRSGMSGDMLLAALGGLGVDLTELEGIFQHAGFSLGVRLISERRHGLAGYRLKLDLPSERTNRNLQDLLTILDRIPVSASVKSRSAAAFQRLAEAEARVHGIDPGEVHFHEVGALDTLVDVIGGFWALEKLQADRVVCSPLPWFRGSIDTEHGRLSLPAPATAELLKGKPVYPTPIEAELITPTGALMIDQLVQEFAVGPQGILKDCSTGWGTMDLEEQPNGMRAFLLEEENADQVWQMTTNVDHLTGEEIGDLIDGLVQEGALDVLYLPGIGKKNRPAGQLQVLTERSELERMEQLLFKESLTLGIRISRVSRKTLPRREAEMRTRFGKAAAKKFEVEGKTFARVEFESLKKLSQKTGFSPAQLRLLLSRGESED